MRREKVFMKPCPTGEEEMRRHYLSRKENNTIICKSRGWHARLKGYELVLFDWLGHIGALGGCKNITVPKYISSYISGKYEVVIL